MKTALLLLFLVGGPAFANDFATSFEFHDTSGQFRVGEVPWVAVCKGGEARKPDNPSYALSGEFSFAVAAGETAVITLPDNVNWAQVFYRDELEAVSSVITFFNANGTSVGQGFGGTNWRGLGIGAANIKRIEVANNAPDSGTVFVDDLVAGTQRTVQYYCDAKPNSCGADAQIYGFGIPSASGVGRFRVFGFGANPGVPGLLLYSAAGPANVPFEGGTLCLSAPIYRSVPVFSDSDGNCQSQFEIDWNAFAAGRLGGNPEPFLLEVGQEVRLQWFGRDTGANGAYLTEGLFYRLCP